MDTIIILAIFVILFLLIIPWYYSIPSLVVAALILWAAFTSHTTDNQPGKSGKNVRDEEVEEIEAHKMESHMESQDKIVDWPDEPNR